LGTFPAVGLVRQWLEAGVIEDGGFLPTEEGAPQGGVISPLLMNVALHGMEAAAGVRYHTTGTRAGKTMPGCPVVIRYADDLLALCHSRDQAVQVKARLSEWLAPRGLVFNETKTQITNFDEGVDFLGFTIRRFRGKLLTKPSNDAMRRIRKRLSTEVLALRGANADMVIAKLNPIITGWAAYYRMGASKRAFSALDAHVWRLVYKWVSLSHSNKSKRWIIARYFGKFNPARQDKWIFGSRDTGFYLRKFAWTPIARHRMVAGTASPDDPGLSEYWAQRRRRSKPPGMGATTLRLLRVQRGRCALCRGLLLHADREPQSPREWEQWLTATRTAIRHHAVTVWGAGTPDERAAIRLIHAHCRRRATGGAGGTAPLHAAREPSGLA
jgi:RNA-directed DNA polymerase